MNQKVTVLSIEPHGEYPAHKYVKVRAKETCHAEQPSFSGKASFTLQAGEEATALVARDVFRNAVPGDDLNGETFCYYALASERADSCRQVMKALS